MAVTAKFIADFAQFNTAVQKAEIELRSFETGASKVQGALERMTNSFTGRRVIQDATLMSEAVERVGGVSRLTESELRKVGATAGEAAAKLRAMGQDVPPGIQKIVDQTKHLNTSQSNLIGTLKNVAGAFGIAFSVQAVTRFVGRVLDSASAIHDMSQKLGISAEAAQRFQYAADQTGSSLETVERAINEMNKGLASGDKSTVKALQAAGLQFSAIRSLKPEDAFAAIAEAVRQIPDPMKQAEVAAQLFGRAALDLLPGIKEGFIQIGKQTTVMSNDTVRALERAQDAWSALGRGVTVATGTMIADMMQLPNVMKDVATSWGKFTEFLKLSVTLGPQAAYHFAAMGTAAKKTAGDINLLPPVIEKTAEQLAAEERAAAKAQEAIRKLADEKKRFKDSVVAMTEKMNLSVFTLNRYGWVTLPTVTSRAVEFREALEGWIPPLESTALDIGVHKLQDIGTAAGKAGLSVAALAKQTRTLGDVLKSSFGNLPSLLIKAFTGGGGVKGAIDALGTQIGEGLFGPDGAFAKYTTKATTSLSSIFGKTIGGALGAAIPAIGALIGPAITGIGKLFGKLFGESELDQVKKLRNEFTKVGSDLHKLESDLRDAGLGHLIENVFKATRVQDFERAVTKAKAELEKYQKVMELGKETWEEIKQVAEKYGITIDQLGKNFQSAMLDEQARDLFREWKLLEGAGVDLNVISLKMKDAILDYIKTAKRLGFEIPQEWKPIIQSLIDQGLLLDENGNVIKDLESAGITFSTNLSAAFQTLIQKIDKMIDGLLEFLDITKNNKPDYSGWAPPGSPAPPEPPGPDRTPLPRKQPDPHPVLPTGTGTLATLNLPTRLATASTGGIAGGVIEHHTHVMLNDREIAEAVERVEAQRFFATNRVRAA